MRSDRQSAETYLLMVLRSLADHLKMAAEAFDNAQLFEPPTLGGKMAIASAQLRLLAKDIETGFEDGEG